jgi:hypothetical protein
LGLASFDLPAAANGSNDHASQSLSLRSASRVASDGASAIPHGTLVVSESGSETGAASRVHVRLDTVKCGQLDRAQCSDQRMHPQLGRLFERLLGSGRRGRRFKSCHPDAVMQVRGHVARSGNVASPVE